MGKNLILHKQSSDQYALDSVLCAAGVDSSKAVLKQKVEDINRLGYLSCQISSFDKEGIKVAINQMSEEYEISRVFLDQYQGKTALGVFTGTESPVVMKKDKELTLAIGIQIFRVGD